MNLMARHASRRCLMCSGEPKLDLLQSNCTNHAILSGALHEAHHFLTNSNALDLPRSVSLGVEHAISFRMALQALPSGVIQSMEGSG